MIVILILLQGCAPRAIEATNAVITPSAVRTAAAQIATQTLPPAQAAAAIRTSTPTAAQTATPQVPQTSTARGEPTATTTLPASAEVKRMSGYGQILALSCEARAAADWARHFGVTIHELDFFSRLPKSKNPEVGFVGSPNGGWGNIPPEAYGVHAGPVAKLLREYGLWGARAVKEMSLDQLRVELSAGRPVIIWVTGHVEPGKGVQVQIEGQAVTVARYEHTVIAIGYDEKSIHILDGKTIYKRPVDTFLKSWEPLGRMAIFWDPESQSGLPWEAVQK